MKRMMRTPGPILLTALLLLLSRPTSAPATESVVHSFDGNEFQAALILLLVFRIL